MKALLRCATVAALAAICAPTSPGQIRWERWRYRWDAADLVGFFPEASLSDLPAFDWAPDQELIQAPYRQGVIDWPEVLRVQVTADGLVYRRPPALPELTAGLMHQAILVELSEGEAPGAAYPVSRRVDLRDLRRLRLQHRPRTPTLYLLRISDLPEGDSTYELVVEGPDGKELGALPLILRGRRPGRVHVRVMDAATGALTPARVGLYQGPKDQGFQYPRSAITLQMIRDEDQFQMVRDATWPSKNRRVFYTRGSFSLDVPAGPQRLIVKKGLEYGLVDLQLTAEAGQTVSRDVVLERALDLPAEGWYSGDEHVHVARDGNNNQALLDWTRGEDVHFTVICQMGDAKRLYYPQYAWQERGIARTGNHFLLSGQEDPRTLRRGHALMIYNAVTHWNPERYHLYGDVFEATRQDGGLAGYAHHGTSFHADRGLAVDVPLGRCDFLEVLQSDVLDASVLYHWWDLGFPLTPLGGSDYPYGRARSLGNSSFFVQVPGEPDVPSWVAAIRAGRTFVSSGPIVDFEVAGQGPGASIPTASLGETVPVRLRVRVNPTLDELAEIRLIRNSEVLETFLPTPDEQHELRREVELPVDATSSAWLALDVRGRRSVAHSNAVFLRAGDRPPCEGEVLVRRVNRSEELLAELEHEIEAGGVPATQARDLRATIERARAVLRDLLTRAGESP